MANALTGDFDVVAEFAVPAANRVLAAMHRNERFLHSISVSVNDNPPPGPRFPGPVILGSVDLFGDPVANQQRIGNPNPFPGASAATNPISAALDAVVNIEQASAFIPPIVPSHLSGKAQVQLSPLTVAVPDSKGADLSVSLQLMSRYFPDPHTSPLAEFIRGEVQITAAVSQVASQVGNTLDIDFKADSAVINFAPAWSSQPLSAEDLAGINLMLRNGLRTSFLPSNVTLPANIGSIRFRTLTGAQSALAILLNMTGAAGNPASMNDVFLGAGDDFGFAVGVDYLRSVLQPTIDNILSQSYSIVIPIDVYFTTYHVSYAITLSSATVSLQNGQIVLATQGKATQTSNKWYAPDNFTFTAQLSFTLQVDGDTADLVPGDVSFDSSSWIVNLFQSAATDGMENVRDQALAQKDANGLDTYAKVRQMLSATGNLGGLLSSLLATARTPRRRVPVRFFPGYKLAYTSVAIQPAGILLHGSLAVTDWPPAYVEFEQIPETTSGGGSVNAGDLLAHGPDFSALKSWIPGGTIQQYEWSTQGQAQPFLIDPNKFVLIHSQTSVAADTATAGAVAAYSPLCLTVRGTRLSSSGPVFDQPVVATVCGFNSFPVVSGLNVSQEAEPLLLALALSNPRGRLVVTGHTSAQLGQAGSGSANRLVHFASEKTAGSLEFLTQALEKSKRDDAATAVLAVLTSDQLSKASYAAGVIYAEDRNGEWETAFRAKTTQRPLTLIVGPKGNILWQQEGDLDSATLAAALHKFLVREASVKLGILRSNLRIGQPVPNFLLGTADGQVTLRKLAGRPCTLIFWRSSLKPSIDAVLDLQNAAAKAGAQSPVILAINDGEDAGTAEKAAAENGVTATLVTDPKREISFACGVNAWPTTIFTDAAGLITAIRCGRFAGSTVQPSSE